MRRGFTIVELLVVVSLIMVLIALLLPTMGKVRETARRTVCTSNQRQIAMAMINYGGQNRGHLLSCRGRQVQKAWNPKQVSGYGHGGGLGYEAGDSDVDWTGNMVGLGIMEFDSSKTGLLRYKPADVWNCPSRDYESQWELAFPQIVMAYNYYGGIKFWLNPWGTFPALSPNRQQTADGRWTLLTDTTMKVDGMWSNPASRGTAYAGLPAHQGPDGVPLGGNVTALDGTTKWIDFKDMVYLHTWSTGGSRIIYSWQEDYGSFTPPPDAYGQP